MGTDRVVVTGGSGKAGVAVVERLRSEGYETVNVDVAASRDPEEPTLVADLTDFGQTVESLEGCDAVVHLAAIRAPNISTDAETFHTNSMSTYNVFSAAELLELDHVVWASSETLIGLPFEREQPRYAPIDEEHPLLPETHYALSKLTGEAMADQFARWTGIPHVGMRISNIMSEDDYERFPGFWDDPTIRAGNLWGYVDAVDVAQMVSLALRSDVSGSEKFLVAAADTCMPTPSLELLESVYPKVPVRAGIEGNQTLLSIDKARQVLGYEPERSWRDFVGA